MKLLVLDGNSILNRAFYGIKLLTTKKGMYTNAIYGFLMMLNKLKSETNPDAVAIAFDKKAPTFRHKAFDGYKAKRHKMPDELFMQFPILKELLVSLGYKLVECEGFEADDILGTLAKTCSVSHNECIIATGDKDSLQLVSEDVSVRLAATKFGKPEVTLYDEQKIMEVYGVTPHELIDIKAIQGDSSDNIPGVAGIGQKGASELIQRYHSIDYIYNNIDSLDIKPGMKKKLLDNKDNAYLSYYLGTIVKDTPIDTNLEDYLPGAGDKNKSKSMLTELEMFSMISKLGLDSLENADKLKQKNTESFERINDLETLKVEISGCSSVAVSIIYEDKKAKQIAVLLDEKKVYLLLSSEGFLDVLNLIFTAPKILVKIHDSKPLFALLDKLGITVSCSVFDNMLAAYLLNPSEKTYEIEKLKTEYGVLTFSAEEFNEVESKLVEIALATQKLANIFNEEIKSRHQKKLLMDIEIPFAKVLASMENSGFLIDQDGLKNYGNVLQNDIENLEQKIHEYIGQNVNINSPKQLGLALFEGLGLSKRKKTKSGYSTSAEVLESLKYEHPVVDFILKYRTVAKLKSTYCDGLIKAVENDGKIHSIFNQTETKTGRISSLEPNLQNIPVRTELGREFRKFFIAKDGCVLVDADYSQIELRILAHIANDETMIDAFKNDLDIHTITASQVFNMPLNMVTPLMRIRAKAVNFGIVYGIGAFSLAKDIGVTRNEAQTYIDNYFKHYSGVEQYMGKVIEQAKNLGYVETLFGRRRYLPELVSSNFNLRAFGERVARNMPIQGTAADIIKIAMVNVYNRLKNEKLSAKLILQVHDEIIVEAPMDESVKVKMILEEEMQNAVNLKVPLTAKANIGKSWYDAK